MYVQVLHLTRLVYCIVAFGKPRPRITQSTEFTLIKLQNKATKIINPTNMDDHYGITGRTFPALKHLILCLPKLYSFSVGKFHALLP